MDGVKAQWIPDDLDYDGSQLRSHFAYHARGILGDSIVAFEGGCRVDLEALVDLEDARSGSIIESRRMVHFLAEHFDRSLERTVLRQRLLVVCVAEALAALGATRPDRRGDDLFVADRKLSVSIATASPVSTLIHLGVNVDAEGAPVPAADLGELGVEARALAGEVLERYPAEMAGIARARWKVRAVP